ncbi:hypothetical protein [Ktedonobacter racemifer]|uniref:hypothetical protein n=1 Tax=Ktedonobacter racemifer TaxID=363277 RepID=UPI0012FB5DE6|nr:hypothetical protein [Ktedonobacter racemifer]
MITRKHGEEPETHLFFVKHIRTFGLKLAGSGNVSGHSTSDLRRIMSAAFTKTVCDNLHVERILSLSPVALLKIEGKGAGLRAKSVHISGHLPGLDVYRSISDTDHVCLLDGNVFVLPFQRGTSLSLFATECYLIAHVVGFASPPGNQ